MIYPVARELGSLPPTPVFENSKLQYIVGSSQDISERKQLERSLQASEKMLRDITQSMGEGLYVMDDQGLITFLNPVATELLGYTEEELLGQVGHDLFHVHNEQGERRPLQQCPIFRAVKQARLIMVRIFSSTGIKVYFR